jgi:hypothetical protein
VGVLLGSEKPLGNPTMRKFVRCPHYWLGYEHAQYGITAEEAVEQGIAPTTAEEATCACYHDGHIVATQFEEPVIGKTRHDPKCNCRWIFVEPTQSTTGTTEDTSETATVTFLVDQNPPQTPWSCSYCSAKFQQEQDRNYHERWCRLISGGA